MSPMPAPDRAKVMAVVALERIALGLHVADEDTQTLTRALLASLEREARLEAKLRRCRDALKFQANSEGGLVAEIDAALAREEAT